MASSFSEANRKAWNDLSAEYNTKPWQQRIAAQVSSALQQRKDWLDARWKGSDESGRDVRLLDYACGTGSITSALAPWVDTIRGIDISENMVEKYNAAARESGMTEDKCHAVVGDLFAKDGVPDHLTGTDLYQFDIAVIGLGFHHFENPTLALKRLTERLKPGEGVLVIVDFLPFTPDHSHAGGGSAAHTIKTHGFDEKAMAKMYKDAGLEAFAFDVLPEPAVMEFESGTKERQVFIAKGRKEKGVWGKLTGWVSEIQEASGRHFPHGHAVSVEEKEKRERERPVRDQFGRRVETVNEHPKGGYDFMGRRTDTSGERWG